MTAITDPFTLPCGAVLPNRLAKAAMTEGVAGADGSPAPGHAALYQRWARGGCGLLISGNIIVDADHLEAPGNVVFAGPLAEHARDMARAWTTAAKSHGALFLAQLSHAGRQTQKAVNPHPDAPSPVKVQLPGGRFGTPRALTEDGVRRIIEAFEEAAQTAMEVGFDGVQIHAAHGYLLSSFLSPLANQRRDDWGGALEHRARLVLEIVARVRARIGPQAVLSVKLNSADFQRGGFAFEDSVQVAQWLSERGVDLLEISGGSYEQPRMMDIDGLDAPDPAQAASTRAREAYFLEFAAQMRAAVSTPLMVTGGFRSHAGMQEALNEGVDVIGLARPLCGAPDAPRALLDGTAQALPTFEAHLKIGPPALFGPHSPIGFLRAINGFGVQSWYYGQIYRMAQGGDPDLTLSPFKALRDTERLTGWLNQARRTPSLGPRDVTQFDLGERS